MSSNESSLNQLKYARLPIGDRIGPGVISEQFIPIQKVRLQSNNYIGNPCVGLVVQIL